MFIDSNLFTIIGYVLIYGFGGGIFVFVLLSAIIKRRRK